MVPHARVFEPEATEVLSASNRHYLERVLRLRPRARFFVTDGDSREVEAELLSGGRFQLVGPWQVPTREPAFRVTLFAAVTKGDRFEGLIEKAVELGIAQIVPLLTQRCQAREPGTNKEDRWRNIAIAAMLQCGGCLLPTIAMPQDLTHVPRPDSQVEALVLHEERNMSAREQCFPLDQARETSSAKHASTREIWLASGPEGGFAEEEIEGLRAAGWRPWCLSGRRLRADTAPIAALALLLCGSRPRT